MIANVINYLVHQPTDTSSPLYLALNTVAMLTLQNVPVGDKKVTLYDTNASEGNIPYVKLYAAPEIEQGVKMVGGSYTEWQTLILDAVAGGTTELSAQNRAEILRLEVETVLKSINFASNSGALADRVSPSNSNYYDGIRAFNVVSNSPQTPASGRPGEYIAVSTVNLKLYVMHGRGR
jgi:hypothetical protein